MRDLQLAIDVLSEAVGSLAEAQRNPKVEELRKKLGDVFDKMLSLSGGNLTSTNRDLDRGDVIPVLNEIIRFCKSDEATSGDCNELLSTMRMRLKDARTHAKRIQQHEYSKYGKEGHRRILKNREIRDLVDRTREFIVKMIEKKRAAGKSEREDKKTGQQSLPGIK